MGRLSDTYANAALDAIFGSGAPATIHVGLSTTTPTNTGTNVTEPSGNGYARVAKTNNATHWPAAAARAKSNGTAIDFPTPTGAGWGTVTHVVLYTAASGGTFIGWAALTASQVIGAGSAVSFPIGALVINAPGS